ncbi:tetratricopeptide repeat protein [Streptosporangium sp. NPDC051022]|uniref:tetratricopeptide repeat protein n=1 Tax=Streptosporangium sp. NPDC051022 TaxID=3155752 RepID=UPI003425A039
MRGILPLLGCLAVSGALFVMFVVEGPFRSTGPELRDTGLETSRPASAPPDPTDVGASAEARLRRAAHLLLRGRTGRAGQVLRRTRLTASAPADLALCDFRLGELEWGRGRPRRALRAYGLALTEDPGHAPSYAGRARAEAALGWTGAAIRDYGAAVARDPGFAVEFGELYEYLGQPARAAQQYAAFTAGLRPMRAAGTVDALEIGRYEADHGDPDSAVRRLRAEWGRRTGVDVADALGWALHRAGRDSEAAGYAARAERLGGHNALFAYHRGEIERALGHPATARDHLARALRINPHFSPQGAPRARQALIELDEQARWAPPAPSSPRPSPSSSVSPSVSPSASSSAKPAPATKPTAKPRSASKPTTKPQPTTKPTPTRKPSPSPGSPSPDRTGAPGERSGTGARGAHEANGGPSQRPPSR